jgi:polygalacturonase
VDIDGCRDVTISDCNIDTDDDALCLKSTLPRPTENVTITNCILRSHCTALKLGTESNGGFRNIAVSNCTILSPRGTKPFWGYPEGRCGIALETVDGGRLENVTISNIVIDGVAIPLFMRLGNRARPHTADAPRPGVGTFRNVTLSSITATGAGKIGCAIAGLPGHRIENVTLRDLRCEFAGGGTTEEANRRIPGLRAVYCATT